MATQRTQAAMNTRDKLLRKAQRSKLPRDWNEYRRKRNFVKNELIRFKRFYFRTKLQENRFKPDSLWKTIKEIFHTNH